MNSNASPRIDPGQEAVKKQREKLKKRWENNSFWHKLKHGPFASTLHTVILYPRVFLSHICSRPLHPSYTVKQEATIRSIKRTMNSSLPVIRKNISFYESIMKTLYCTEPFVPMKGVNDVNGYWLGAELWKGKHSEATLFYIHGGGFVSSSSLSGLRALCYLLETLRTKYDRHVRAFAVEYSLAPENQFPTGLNDVERAYKWLASSDIPGSRNVFLCGDSAGGTMVLGLLQKLYSDNNFTTFAEKSIHPLGCILISPWVEASCESLSYFTNSKYDIISSYGCQLAAENYLFGKEGRSNVTEKRNTLRIIDWLNKVETSLDFVDNDGEDGDEKNNLRSSSIYNKENDRRSNNNNEKRNSISVKNEWMHEVVQVRTHSGEGIPTGRYNRGSRRNSQSSRRVHDSSIIININNDFSETDSLSPPKVQQHEQNEIASTPVKNFNKRNSKIRFSDSLEIHIQTDLDKTKNVKRGSWIRKSTQFYEIPLDSPPQSPKSPKSPQSPQSPQSLQSSQLPQSFQIPFSSNPFENPLISPLRIPKHILAKFPPLFISYGGKEIFRDDIEKFCKKCIESKKVDNNDGKQSHSDVIIEIDEDMVHSYPILLSIFGKRSKNALSRMADFLNTHIPNIRSSSILRRNSVINDKRTSSTATNISNDSFITTTTTTATTATTNDTNRFNTYDIIKEVKNRFSTDKVITEMLNRFDTDSVISDSITDSIMTESIITEVDYEAENIARKNVAVEKMFPLTKEKGFPTKEKVSPADPKRLSSASTASSSTLQPLRPVYIPIQPIHPIVSPKQPIYPSIRPIISSLQPIYHPRRNSFSPQRRFSHFSRFSQYSNTSKHFKDDNVNVQFRTNIVTPNDKLSRQSVVSKEVKVSKSPSIVRSASTKSTHSKFPNPKGMNLRSVSFTEPDSHSYY